jgi:hypothetical protein
MVRLRTKKNGRATAKRTRPTRNRAKPLWERAKRRALNPDQVQHIACTFQQRQASGDKLPSRMTIQGTRIYVKPYTFNLGSKATYPCTFGLIEINTMRPVVPLGEDGDTLLEGKAKELCEGGPDKLIGVPQALSTMFDIHCDSDSDDRLHNILGKMMTTPPTSVAHNGADTDVANTVNALVKIAASNLHNVGALTGKVGELTGNVGVLTGKVEELTGNVGELTGNVGALTNIFREQFGKLNDQVGKLDGGVHKLDGRVDKLDGEMIETAKKMTYLESQVSLLLRSAMAPLDLNGKLDGACVDTPIKQLLKGPSPVTLDSKPVPQKVTITPMAPTPGGQVAHVTLTRKDLKRLVPFKMQKAIRKYTGSWYHAINDQLRGLKPMETSIQELIDLMIPGLTLLPPYVGTVYRGCDHDEAFVNRLRSCAGTGEPFIDRGFYSSTTDRDLIKFKFLNCRFIIQSKTGRSIVHFASTGYTDEEEVLFLPSTKFCVLLVAACLDDLDRTVIKMEEV